MTQPTTTDRDHQLVQSRLMQAYRDMAAGDIERLLELYLPDALIQGPAQPPIVGTAAIRAFWLARFERFHVEIEPQVQEVTVFGDIFVVRGRTVGVFSPRNSDAAVPVDSWFLQIYRRQADGTLLFWRGVNGPNP
jgi:ketosteroid isomerase-like protein